MQRDLELVLALDLAHDDRVAVLDHRGRRRHPVQRLVAAGVGVDEDRAVRLEHDQPQRLGQVGGQAAGVLDGAAGDDQTHRSGHPRPGSGRPEGCRRSDRALSRLLDRPLRHLRSERRVDESRRHGTRRRSVGTEARSSEALPMKVASVVLATMARLSHSAAPPTQAAPFALGPMSVASSAEPVRAGLRRARARRRPTASSSRTPRSRPTRPSTPPTPNNVVAFWQQDRWSDGGSHGTLAGYSLDGGAHVGAQRAALLALRRRRRPRQGRGLPARHRPVAVVRARTGGCTRSRSASTTRPPRNAILAAFSDNGGADLEHARGSCASTTRARSATTSTTRRR